MHSLYQEKRRMVDGRSANVQEDRCEFQVFILAQQSNRFSGVVGCMDVTFSPSMKSTFENGHHLQSLISSVPFATHGCESSCKYWESGNSSIQKSPRLGEYH